MVNTGLEHWDNFLNKASLGVHLVNSDGKILWANDTELQLLGYEREEYVNRHIAEFHADSDVIEKILGILTGGGMLHAYPARLSAKDGSIKHVLINSNVFSQDGEFMHTRCFTTSISEAVYNQLRMELLESIDA